MSKEKVVADPLKTKRNYFLYQIGIYDKTNPLKPAASGFEYQ